jgi:hypothetical protein
MSFESGPGLGVKTEGVTGFAQSCTMQPKTSNTAASD